jgi:hypothetical protein
VTLTWAGGVVELLTPEQPNVKAIATATEPARIFDVVTFIDLFG